MSAKLTIDGREVAVGKRVELPLELAFGPEMAAKLRAERLPFLRTFIVMDQPEPHANGVYTVAEVDDYGFTLVRPTSYFDNPHRPWWRRVLRRVGFA